MLGRAGTCLVNRCREAPFCFRPSANRPGRQSGVTARASIGTGTQGKKVEKVVLAYSGGLDTSVILTWLQETYDCEVVTFTADLGQVLSTTWKTCSTSLACSCFTYSACLLIEAANLAFGVVSCNIFALYSKILFQKPQILSRQEAMFFKCVLVVHKNITSTDKIL